MSLCYTFLRISHDHANPSSYLYLLNDMMPATFTFKNTVNTHVLIHFSAFYFKSISKDYIDLGLNLGLSQVYY